MLRKRVPRDRCPCGFLFDSMLGFGGLVSLIHGASSHFT